MNWQEQRDWIRQNEERIARVREGETPAQRQLRDMINPGRSLPNWKAGLRGGKLVKTGELPLDLVRQCHKDNLAQWERTHEAIRRAAKDPHEDPPVSE